MSCALFQRAPLLHSRSGKGEDTVSLGNLGLGLKVTEDGVLVELGVEAVNLALDGLLNLLNVGVVHKVLLNLLSLRRRHLESVVTMNSSSESRLQCNSHQSRGKASVSVC